MRKNIDSADQPDSLSVRGRRRTSNPRASLTRDRSTVTALEPDPSDIYTAWNINAVTEAHYKWPCTQGHSGKPLTIENMPSQLMPNQYQTIG